MILVLLFFCIAKIASADPCVISPDGKQVICEKAGFDRAVKKCSDGISGEAECKLKLAAVEASWRQTKDALDACATTRTPPNPALPIVGYMAGLVGLGSMLSTSMFQMPDGVRWGLGLGGAISVVGGLFLVLPPQ
jgi:hypothetical protein